MFMDDDECIYDALLKCGMEKIFFFKFCLLLVIVNGSLIFSLRILSYWFMEVVGWFVTMYFQIIKFCQSILWSK